MEAERAVRGLNTDGTFAPHAVGGGSSTKVFDGTDRLLAERNASSYNAGLSQWPTILLGNLLALRRRGRYGLLFLDGHADFYQPAAEPNGEAASMDLALATGRGPAVVTDIEGRCPLVRDEDVVVFGRRDAADAEAHGRQRTEDTAIALTDLAAVRAAEIEAAVASAVERLSKSELDGVWIHLYADVLDGAVMPAVDYRLPDGLSWDELAAILRAGVGSGRAVGINVTIFNPKLDGDGSIARAFIQALTQGLKP